MNFTKRNFLRFSSGVILLAGLVTGCVKKSSQEGGEQQASVGETILKIGVLYDSTGKGDRSINDSVSAGIDQAKKELGIDDLQVISRAESEYESDINALAEKGLDLVVVAGVTTRTALERAAKANPNTKFIYIGPSVGLPNVASVDFKEEEGSFLAGHLAGLVTKTKKIGAVLGMDIPVLRKFYAGYKAGAHFADPAVTVLEPKFIGTFENMDTAKAAATVLYDQGADIVYQVAGAAGLGVLRAAKDQNKLAIGVDGNQDDVYPGSVLTSMMKRCDVAVFNLIKDYKEGKYSPGAKVFGIKEGGMSLTDMKHTRHLVAPEHLKKLEETKEKIIREEIKVPTS